MSALDFDSLRASIDKPILETILIQFDGGCVPNPGEKYGSFLVRRKTRGGRIFEVFRKIRFPLGIGTNNEAEFESLEAALKWTLMDLMSGGFDLSRYAVSILTDSTIVSNHLKYPSSKISRTDSRKAAMQERALSCLQCLWKFGEWKVDWTPREANVREFGH